MESGPRRKKGKDLLGGDIRQRIGGRAPVKGVPERGGRGGK